MTRPTAGDLERCWRCGGTPDARNCGDGWGVYCQASGCYASSIITPDRDDAVAWWNRREAVPALMAKVERKDEAIRRALDELGASGYPGCVANAVKILRAALTPGGPDA